jgi:anti-sigma factor RsiW
MSDHLSEDQFAKCIVGRSTRAELQHIRECPECSVELERFDKMLSLFRTAVRDRIDDRVALHPPDETPLRRREAGISILRWAWVTAAIVALVIPLFMSEKKPQKVDEQLSTETNPVAIMDRVNLHLSRTVPAPMEPMMSLIPSDELISNSGGVR